MSGEDHRHQVLAELHVILRLGVWTEHHREDTALAGRGVCLLADELVEEVVHEGALL